MSRRALREAACRQVSRTWGAALLAAVVGLAGACGGPAQPDPGTEVPAQVQDIPAPASLDALSPVLADRVRAALGELRAAPQDPERWLALGMTYEANDLAELALACYEHVTRSDSAPKLLLAKAWSRRAQAHEALGEVEPALEEIQRSIDLVGDYAPSWWRLGNYRFDWGEFDAAAAAFRRATELDPAHSGGFLGLARVALQQDRPEDAIAILNDLLARKPKDSDARRLLRTALTQAGRPEEAIGIGASWKRKSSPGRDPWLREFRAYKEKPRMEQALADLQGGNAASAVEVLEGLAEERPDDLNVLSFLAWGRHLLGNASGAAEAIAQGLEVDPDSVLILRVQARIQESNGEREEALVTLEHLLSVDPQDTQALRKAGKLFAESGRLAQAYDHWSRLLALDGSDAEVWHLAADALVELDRFDEAEGLCRRAIEHRVNDGELRRALARALAGQERWVEAEEALGPARRFEDADRALLRTIRSHESP